MHHLHNPLITYFLHNIFTMQVDKNILDIIIFCIPHNSLGYPVTNTLFRCYRSEGMARSIEGHCLIDLQICCNIFQITIGGLIGDRQIFWHSSPFPSRATTTGGKYLKKTERLEIFLLILLFLEVPGGFEPPYTVLQTAD